MEACYLDSNAPLAFYFMEKSRAVLLSDKLNELGASAHLPHKEMVEEEMLQTKVKEAAQQLVLLPPLSKAYAQEEYHYINRKQELERFIQSLEKNYPAYHQYKYADSVPTLASLQQYLAQNRQSFVHYFRSDTVMYLLGITPKNAKLVKLSQTDFNTQQLAAFLSFCSDKDKLKKEHQQFTFLAYNIYHQLFQATAVAQRQCGYLHRQFPDPF